MFWWLLLWACTSDVPVSEQDPVAGDGPRHPDAVWTAQEVGWAIEDAAASGLPDPVVIATRFQELLSRGDDRCPGGDFRAGGLQVFNPEGCMADSGYHYEGTAGGAKMFCEGIPGEPGENGVLCTAALRGDAHITDPDGHAFLVGGYVVYDMLGDMGTEGAIALDLYGTWGYPAAAEPWLAGDLSLGLTVAARWRPELVDQVQLSGGFSTDIATMDMRALSFDGACGSSPTGRVGIRGADGYWYDLDYDPESCDNCGDVTFDSRQALGRACADLRPAMSLLASDLWRANHDALQAFPPR